MTRKGVRRLVGKVTGANAIDALRDEVGALAASTQEMHGEVTEEINRNRNLLYDVHAREYLFVALNKQINGENLRRIVTRDKKQRSIFVLGLHEWGNIGDLAIGYSEVAFLEKHFPEYPIFNVARLTLLANWQRIVSAITKDDIIVIHGGGNMGSLWPEEERTRRAIIRTFAQNPIISFPQSIYFEDDSELQLSADIYNAHKKLLIAVRDDSSHAIAQKHFNKCSIVRTEDIVLSYEYPVPDRGNKDGVIYITRNDVEKKRVPALDNLHKLIDADYETYISDTTAENLNFESVEYGASLVYGKIDELHTHRLVVTDRLHGAVFALHAGRPVIVIENNYGKIGGALKNISKVLGDRIIFANDNASNISKELVKKLYSLDTESEMPSHILKAEIEKFADAIRNFIH